VAPLLLLPRTRCYVLIATSLDTLSLIALLFIVSVARSWVIFRKFVKLFFLGIVWLLCVDFKYLGKGFSIFLMHQLKERASSVVITVLEGNVGTREIENEFNQFFGARWRCTTCPIGPGQFTMHLPNPREVERAVYYGKKMRLRTVEATVKLSNWTASVGAK
jgi:hypothetical protein